MLLGALSGALSGNAAAASGPDAPIDPEALVDRAAALGLAGTTQWRRLLHVPGRGTPELDEPPASSTSQVDDPRFFLAPRGRTDPAAELEASLRALFGDASRDDGDANPRCRFVARERWLRERLGLAPEDAPAACEEYRRWRDTLGAHSATLVFPAAYLNNPSSMFGHTLLRLDPVDVEQGSDWLSWSVNFAADTGNDPTQGPLYAFKGITGGYPGRFSLQPYFTKLRDYGAMENRDIWEYPLDLSPAEVDRLVQHLWELRDVRFDYFFFRENCSLRLLELFEHARPSLDLVSAFPLTAIPADTVREIGRAGLIDGARWLPSTTTLLRHELAAVPAGQRAWIETLVKDPAEGGRPDFRAMDPDARARLVAVADRLLTYRTRRAPKTAERARTRLAMLSLLAEQTGRGGNAGGTGDAGGPTGARTGNASDRGGTSAGPPLPPPSPDAGHRTTLASLGVGTDDGLGHVELGVRASYHDLLDPAAGYVPGAGISLGELRVRADEDGEARIESFAVIGLRSLAPSVPLLPATSWGVDIGLVRDEDVENGRLMLRAGGLVGRSRELDAGGLTGLAYALVGPSFDAVDRAGDAGLDARANAHARVGLLAYGPLGATRAELGADSLQGRPLRVRAELAHDLPIGRDRSLRASGTVSEFDGQRRETVELAVRVHF